MSKRRPDLVSRRRWLGLGGAGLCAMGGFGCGPRPSSQAPTPVAPTTVGAADLLVTGGRIETLDPAQPQAAALVVTGSRIVAVGSRDDVALYVGSRTRVVDLRGGLAVPGLVDAHAHLAGLGASLEQIDLRGATSVQEVVARCQAGDQGQAWILGRGWDQNLWADSAMPTHAALTAAFPDRPVWLRRVDGHAGWANLAALQAAGIGDDTRAPAGGEILRDAKGRPTGVLVDAAMGLLSPPPPSEPDLQRQLLAAQDHVVRRGLTGVHDMGIGPDTDAVYERLRASADPQARLSLRVTAYAAQDWFATLSPDRPRPMLGGDLRYRLAGVKLYADGALGSRGAAMLADYSDRPGHRGLMQNSPAQLGALCRKAAAERWQVATHAIGDAANRAVLDEYEKALADAGDDPRWRIEHAQIVDPADIPRFAALGVVASMQPTHATSDMPWVPARVGPARLWGAYAWRSFLDAGVALAFGSDFPVELPDVTHGLYAAITRQDPKGEPAAGWQPEQRLSIREALAAFSSGAAHAAHDEADRGRLAAGYLADISCFDRDLTRVEPAQLRDATARATIIGGDVVFES
jgi:predicted amidohydrolase YtcJ